MNSKKAISSLLIVLVSASFAGCATAKKKFIRKRKEPEVRPVVYTQDKFVQQFSNKYHYTTHFTYWKTWHGELINYLSGNAKRARRAGDEAVSHLQGMQRYLIEPKRTELGSQIDDLKAAVRAMDAGGTQGDKSGLQQRLEKSMRIINSSFYYKKVMPFILPDAVDLSNSNQIPAASNQIPNQNSDNATR